MNSYNYNITYQYNENINNNSSIEKEINYNDNNYNNMSSNDILYNTSSWKYISSDSLRNEILALKEFLYNELKSSEIEIGKKTKIEGFVINNYSDELYMALSEIFAENIEDSDLIIKIIRCLSQISNKKINSGAKLLVASCLNMKNIEVVAQAIEVFGIWNDCNTIKILSSFTFKESWLNKYVTKIIEGIEKNGE